jgi:hypothetical protein
LVPHKQEHSDKQIALIDDFDWTQQAQPQRNPFSFSSHGNDYTGLGCFVVGLEPTAKDFNNLCDQQRHLKSLGLLDPLKLDRLNGITQNLRKLYGAYSTIVPLPAEV